MTGGKCDAIKGRTKLALKALGLGDLVDADQGSVSDVIQDGVEDSRLGGAKEGQRAKYKGR